jgi:hypothetical protein
LADGLVVLLLRGALTGEAEAEALLMERDLLAEAEALLLERDLLADLTGPTTAIDLVLEPVFDGEPTGIALPLERVLPVDASSLHLHSGSDGLDFRDPLFLSAIIFYYIIDKEIFINNVKLLLCLK